MAVSCGSCQAARIHLQSELQRDTIAAPAAVWRHARESGKLWSDPLIENVVLICRRHWQLTVIQNLPQNKNTALMAPPYAFWLFCPSICTLSIGVKLQSRSTYEDLLSTGFVSVTHHFIMIHYRHLNTQEVIWISIRAKKSRSYIPHKLWYTQAVYIRQSWIISHMRFFSSLFWVHQQFLL